MDRIERPLLWLLILSLVGLFVCLGRAAADDGLLVAKVCYLESSYRRPDCAAIVAVARARASRVDRPWQDVLLAYSALSKGSERAAMASAFSREAGPRGWLRFLRYADLVAAGSVPNPCPGARHWGSPSLPRDVANARDAVASGRWVLAACATSTANVFYRETP